MSVTEWPKQNTGVFAVPFCVQCCTYTPSTKDTWEVQVNNASWYTIHGVAPFDGSGGVLYRTCTWSGSLTIRVFDGSDECNSGEMEDSPSVATFSGSATVDLGDVWSESGALTMEQGGNTSYGSLESGGYLASPTGIGVDGVTGTEAGAVETVSGANICSLVNQTTTIMSRTTGTATATLSNPVSESAAIAWAESEYPGWSDWMGVVPTNRTWSSFWQAYVPGQGGQYSYLKVNFRRIKGGFTPGNEYVCTMDVYRAGPEDPPSWSLFATIEETLIANSSGELVWTGSVPFTRGYRTFVDATSFTTIPA